MLHAVLFILCSSSPCCQTQQEVLAKTPFTNPSIHFLGCAAWGSTGKHKPCAIPYASPLDSRWRHWDPANISALIPSSACKRGESWHCWEAAGRVRAKGGRPRVRCWSWPPAQDACSELSWDCQLLHTLTWQPRQQNAALTLSLGHSPKQLATCLGDLKY